MALSNPCSNVVSAASLRTLVPIFDAAFAAPLRVRNEPSRPNPPNTSAPRAPIAPPTTPPTTVPPTGSTLPIAPPIAMPAFADAATSAPDAAISTISGTEDWMRDPALYPIPRSPSISCCSMKRRTARASWSVTFSPACIFFIVLDIETVSPIVEPVSIIHPTNGMYERNFLLDPETSEMLVSPERNPSFLYSPLRWASMSVRRRRPSSSFSSSARENWRPNTLAAVTSPPCFPSGS